MPRTKKSEYVEGIELRRYIWRNYRHALTDREKALHHAVVLELKARHARSAASAARLRSMPGHFLDPDVVAITERGLGSFVDQCCERLLRDLCGRDSREPLRALQPYRRVTNSLRLPLVWKPLVRPAYGDAVSGRFVHLS